jgi:protein phosphatase
MILREAIEIAVSSDTGRVRQHNEDSTAQDVDIGLAVLADGMGGYRAGEVASAIATMTIYREIRSGLETLVRGQTDQATGYRYESLVMRDAIASANEVVYEAACEDPEFNGMGTTVVATLFYDNRVTIAHVGDSRGYRWRDGKLEQLTVDHTVVQEYLNSGLYTPEQARVSTDKNLVTRALGIAADVEVALGEYKVQSQDLYLLCSDGLTDLVDDPAIAAALEKRDDSLKKSAVGLVELANSNGGLDNISIILVRITQPFTTPSSWQTKLADWFTVS